MKAGRIFKQEISFKKIYDEVTEDIFDMSKWRVIFFRN